MKSFALLLFVATISSLWAQTAPVAVRPNIVFILADDLGWSDLAVYGSSFHETPNLDRLAAQGMRFTQAYAASNVCSPTRASILTGRYPARVGITDWLPGRKSQPQDRLLSPALPSHLDPSLTTLADSFHRAGYRTAFVGKWHLGGRPEELPDKHGFDLNIGGSGKGHPPSYFSPYHLENLPDGPAGEHLDERLTREAIAFMRQAATKEQPFLLYLSHYAVHNPLQAKPEVVAKYQAKPGADQPGKEKIDATGPDGRERVRQGNPLYAAMVESLDSSVGRVMAALEELGLSKNTLVVFTSDNGGLSTAEGWPTSNRPLRAGKGWAYEGGVREPLIVSWPGQIPAGTVSDAVVISPDFFPTLLDMAGRALEPKSHLDGLSFAPALKSLQATLPDRPVFWHYPHYSNQRGRPHSAIRQGKWKLIEWLEDGRVELLDLSTDLTEAHDVAKEQAERAAALLAELQEWRHQVGARMLSPNINYKPKP